MKGCCLAAAALPCSEPEGRPFGQHHALDDRQRTRDRYACPGIIRRYVGQPIVAKEAHRRRDCAAVAFIRRRKRETGRDAEDDSGTPVESVTCQYLTVTKDDWQRGY